MMVGRAERGLSVRFCSSLRKRCDYICTIWAGHLYRRMFSLLKKKATIMIEMLQMDVDEKRRTVSFNLHFEAFRRYKYLIDDYVTMTATLDFFFSLHVASLMQCF